MPTTNKQQALTQVLTALKRHYDPPAPHVRPVFEQLIYGVLREGAAREQADAAYRNLTERFFDWNEVRVTSVQEVEAALEDLPDAPAKAERVVGILQSVFEQHFCFNLEEISKKGLKNAAKHLAEKIAGVTDFSIAWVLQQALGGHAIPLDGPTLRVLGRLGVADPAEGLDSIRSGLEHYVPKAKGPAFVESLSVVARDVCWEEEPHCSACGLRGECPTGQMRKGSESRSSRLKPR